jgi:hypothetical protein
MKTLLYFFIFSFISFNFHTIEAQEKQKLSSNSIDNQNSFYIEKLKLANKLAAKFIEINSTYEEQVDALQKEAGSKDYKAKLKALEQERDDNLKKLLSKKQFKKYKALRREKRKQLQGLIRKQR